MTTASPFPSPSRSTCLSPPRPRIRQTLGKDVRDLISKGVVDRGEGQLQSLAHVHLDIRTHPPDGCLLFTVGAPYSSINQDRLRGLLPYMLVDQHPSPSLPHLCDLGYERALLRCFVECTPESDHDPWDPSDLFCRTPISAIENSANARIEDTRAYKAYTAALIQSSLQPSVTPQSSRAPFDRPSLAMTLNGGSTVDAIITTHRFEPIRDNGIALNLQEELYLDAINSLSAKDRHELHLKHCCSWSGAMEGRCKCPNYSESDPRTRLPRLLPQIAFGVEGASAREKIIAARMLDQDYIKKRQKEHADSVWQKSLKRLNGPQTRACIAEALLRLLAAYEMCGSVYGAAVVSSRFTRFFVLSPNRIAVEILEKPRTDIGGMPRSLPWTEREQAEAKMAYVERRPNPPRLPPIMQANRRVVSEAQPPFGRSRDAPTPRAPRRSLPAPKTPPQTPSPPPQEPFSNDHASFIKYGLPPMTALPAAHNLRTPPRKLTWKAVMRRARPSLNSHHDSPKSVTESPPPTEASPRPRQRPTNTNKPLPSCPRPVFPTCSLPPDYRASLSFKEVFSEDPFKRLPWSFAAREGQSSLGPSRKMLCTIDRDATHAFSNLLTAAIVRTGQIPFDYPYGPLPITNHFPRNDLVGALAHRSALPAELAEYIVDLSLAIDEQPFVHSVRQERYQRDREMNLRRTVCGSPLVSHVTASSTLTTVAQPSSSSLISDKTTVSGTLLPSRASTPSSSESNASTLPLSGLSSPHGYPQATAQRSRASTFSSSVTAAPTLPPPNYPPPPPPSQPPTTIASRPPVPLVAGSKTRLPVNRPQFDLCTMERALDETVRFVPVSRGEMEALIGRQARADRRRYFHTYSRWLWPEHWQNAF